LYIADEVFFSGTAAEITPIRSVDKIKVGNGDFPVVREVQKMFFDLVDGKIEKYLHWLTPVYK
jgi:branched-chain amino acid aminotransferase